VAVSSVWKLCVVVLLATATTADFPILCVFGSVLWLVLLRFLCLILLRSFLYGDLYGFRCVASGAF
jgi:hypothetical protein